MSLSGLVLEGNYAVLMALIESLDMGDGDGVSDEVAANVLSFLSENGQIVPFLKLLVSREAANTENPSTLFRGNSVASKVISKWTVLNARDFLQAVLSPLVQAASQVEPNQVELNPEKGGSNEGASELTRLCQLVLSASLASIDQCPLEVRELCMHMQEVVAARFGDKMGSSAVGGYVYLRFVCPAMVAPEHYGFPGDARRVLMSVSKVIQALANGITAFKVD